MNRLVVSAFMVACVSSALVAEEEPSHSLWDYHPLHLSGNFMSIGKASVDAPQGGHLTFQKSNVVLTMLLPVSATSYFFPRVEWNGLTLNWNHNPKFNQTQFYYAQFGLMFYSTAIEKWRWILRAEYNLDLKHCAHPGTYGLFSGLIWGAHELDEHWHYHVGATGYIGLKGNIMYPLIGVDYSPDGHWIFQGIFPIDYSIQYKLNSNWKFSAKIRPLKERFRAGSHQPQPRSIFNYSSAGAELNIRYEIPMRLELEVYGGYNIGGNFYIKNQSGHNALYTTIDGAPYVGGTIDYAF